MLTSGGLRAYIGKGVSGVTTNPHTYERAIIGCADYDEDMCQMALNDVPTLTIYERLVADDLGRAANTLYPIYHATEASDGYVSMAINPHKAYDTAGIVHEARHIFSLLNRPNILVSIPATNESFPAIEQLISDGINVNCTLIFSLTQYMRAAEAYIKGLERRLDTGDKIDTVASFASFYISNIDTVIDKRFEQTGALDLMGHIAINNAKMAYALFRGITDSERWRRLVDEGARQQRLVWTNTCTSNPDYINTWYVDNLIGPDTVNTMPLSTIKAFLDHGSVAERLSHDLGQAETAIGRLHEAKIDFDGITAQLLHDGIEMFNRSFDTTLVEIGESCHRFMNMQRRKAA
jgi:transaldolase